MTPEEFTKWYDSTGLCGCHCPVSSVVLIRDILEAIVCDYPEGNKRIAELLPSDGLIHFVLSVLDNNCLIDHGACLTAAWITDKGKDLLDFLRGKSNTEIEHLIFPWNKPKDKENE